MKNSNTHSVSVLGVWREPATSYVVNELLNNRIKIDAVYFDSKFASKKDIQTWQERTQNNLPGIPYSNFSKFGIPFFFVDRHDSLQTSNLISSRDSDLIVSSVTPRILKKNTFDATPRGVLNVHPGLLPDFRGCTCVEWALYLDKKIGNTVHFMNENIDQGPIVYSESISFNDCTNYHEIRCKVYTQGFELLRKAIHLVFEKNLSQTKLPNQPQKGNLFKVIDSKKLQIVKEKVAARKYVYQRKIDLNREI